MNTEAIHIRPWKNGKWIVSATRQSVLEGSKAMTYTADSIDELLALVRKIAGGEA